MKASVSSTRIRGGGGGDKKCSLNLSKIIFTNFIIKFLAERLKLGCGTSGFRETQITAVIKQAHILDKLTAQRWLHAYLNLITGE
jgi:hypothetical protein